MADYLDLRDLATELADLTERDADPDDQLDDDDAERLTELRAFAESFCSDTGAADLASYADNEPTAIPESDFTEYAEQLAEDIGYVDRDSQMTNYIDWERWASDLKHDYTSFTYQGDTYLVRAY